MFSHQANKVIKACWPVNMVQIRWWWSECTILLVAAGGNLFWPAIVPSHVTQNFVFFPHVQLVNSTFSLCHPTCLSGFSRASLSLSLSISLSLHPSSFNLCFLRSRSSWSRVQKRPDRRQQTHLFSFATRGGATFLRFSHDVPGKTGWTKAGKKVFPLDVLRLHLSGGAWIHWLYFPCMGKTGPGYFIQYVTMLGTLQQQHRQYYSILKEHDAPPPLIVV